MKFNLEKLLIFWQLRNIVIYKESELPIVGHKRIRLDNGKVNLSVLYYKIEDEYELSFVQRVEADPELGTSITHLLGNKAMAELNKI